MVVENLENILYTEPTLLQELNNYVARHAEIKKLFLMQVKKNISRHGKIPDPPPL